MSSQDKLINKLDKETKQLKHNISKKFWTTIEKHLGKFITLGVLLAIAFLVAIGIEFYKLDSPASSPTRWSYFTHIISALAGGIVTILTRRNNKNDK